MTALLGAAGCGGELLDPPCASQSQACLQGNGAQPRSSRVGFLIGDPREIKLAASIGSTWVRTMANPFSWAFAEPRRGAWDFSLPDRYVREAQRHDINILANIWPYTEWDQLACHDQSCAAPGPFFDPNLPKPYTCMPCSEASYKEFVRRLVERYDGDGVDDMRGLSKPITHWEILNEPAANNGTFSWFSGTPAEYVTLLRWSHEAIAEACPTCKVLVGGASNNEEPVHEYHGEVLRLGGDQYFDVANIHFVENEDYQSLNVAGYRSFLDAYGVNKPIWVTEVQFPQRSVDVITSVEGAFAAGADKLFFVSFEIGKLHNGDDFTSFSEVYRTIVAMFP